MGLLCYFCLCPLEEERIYRTSLCPRCGGELKICYNCRFYDPNAHWECRETISESVSEKDKANFCDSFSPGISNALPPRKVGKKKDARKQFDALFDSSS